MPASPRSPHPIRRADYFVFSAFPLPTNKSAYQNQWFTCLAVSDDGGVTFTKPNLGVIEVGGSNENNCVWPPGGWDAAHHETGTVFIDSNPAVPAEERIKMIATWGGPSKGSTDGMYTFASADGIHFKPLSPTPACTSPSPTQPSDGC